MDALSLDYRRIDPEDPIVAELIARHAAHGDAHYPAESNHHQDGAAMAAEGVFCSWGFVKRGRRSRWAATR
jgi:hypothetical protein